jgi:hypothetical protein
MDDTPLTNEELTQALRKVQNDLSSLRERTETLEHHKHQHERGWTYEPVTKMPGEPPTLLSQRPPQSPLPSRLRPT